MSTPPEATDAAIRAWLADRHGFDATRISRLPPGADADAAAWRVQTAGGDFFLKLKGGSGAVAALAVPRYLADAGIAVVVAPRADRDGNLASSLGAANAILYPFVEGKSAADLALTPDQWVAFGRSVRRVHETELPAPLAATLRKEDFAPAFRTAVKRLLPRLPALGLSGAMCERARVVAERAAALADTVAARALPLVPCHADLHALNVMVATDGALAIVDWDDVMLAPKERDLMFIGGGVAGVWSDPAETAAFLTGYGDAPVDPVAIAYYRYERIAVDIALIAELLLDDPPADAERWRGFLFGQFAPGGVADIADATWAGLAGRANR